MNYHDNLFDKKFLDELSYKLINSAWYANNAANRKSFPKGEYGSHLLLGQLIFKRFDNDFIEYFDDRELVETLVNCFRFLCNNFKANLRLSEIATNLQFKGMNGTNHTDGNSNQHVFLLLLDRSTDDNKGGEFINVTRNKKVKYKYGRVIQFQADDLHRANPFNVPHVPRMSIKWVGDKL